MRAAFITGLGLHPIRQCLLENKTLDLQTAYTRASSLDLVEQDNDLYTTLEAHMSAIVDLEPTKRPPVEPNEPAVAATCGFPYHLLERCPALVTTRKKNLKANRLRLCMSVKAFVKFISNSRWSSYINHAY